MPARIAIFTIFIVAANLFLGTPAARPDESGKNNIIIYWTDGEKLKAVTLTCLNKPPNPVGIVSIPIRTALDPENPFITVEKYYYQKGRETLSRRLEKLFGIPIGSYVHVRQETLEHFSEILGPIQLGAYNTTLAEMFEGTYVDRPVNLQWEIRCFAQNMLKPSIFLKIPRLIWVYSTEIESNLTVDHALAFYGIIRGWGPEILQKQALPGKEYRIGNKKYRLVQPEAWAQTLRAVTTPEKG